MTTYEAIIKVGVHDPQLKRAADIATGLEYAAVLLVDEYGWTPDAVEQALDNAYGAANDEWERIHDDEAF